GRTRAARLLPRRPSPSRVRNVGCTYEPPTTNSARPGPFAPVADDVIRIQVTPVCCGNVTVPLPVAFRANVVLKPLEKVSVGVPRKARVLLLFWTVTLVGSTGNGKRTS